MRNLVSRMGRWLAGGVRLREPGPPFEVRCACGQTTTGLRQSEHQILRCPGCGGKLFVFPYSPLPRVFPGTNRSYPFLRLTGGRAWLLPIAAAGLTLTAVVAVFAIVLIRLSPSPAPHGDDLEPRIAAGKKALADGNFHLAIENLKAATELRNRNPAALPADRARELTRLYRQALLLDDLLSESLGEIVVKAAGEPEPEWQADFARRYQGKAVVFEAWLRWDAVAGRFILEYPILAGHETVRLEWGGLRLFEHVPPVEQPQLVLFGVRLADVRRDRQGDWVIRFDPDSGVFLTDPGAAAACCPRDLDDRLRAVLEQQAKWDDPGG